MNASEIIYKVIFDEANSRLLNAIEVEKTIDLWLINELCKKSIDYTTKKFNVHSTDLLSNINYAQLINDLKAKATSLGVTILITPSELIGGTIDKIDVLHFAQVAYINIDGVKYQITNETRVNNGCITEERNTSSLEQRTITYVELFRKEHGKFVQDVVALHCDNIFVTLRFPVVNREDYEQNRVRITSMKGLD